MRKLKRNRGECDFAYGRGKSGNHVDTGLEFFMLNNHIEARLILASAGNNGNNIRSTARNCVAGTSRRMPFSSLLLNATNTLRSRLL